MKNSWLLVIFIILSFIQLLQINALHSKQQNLLQEKKSIIQEYGLLNDQLSNYEMLNLLQYEFEGKTIKNSRIIDYKLKDTISIYELSQNKSFIFYIPEEGCSNCYINFLKELDSFVDKNNLNYCYIIADFDDLTSLKILLRNNKIKMKTFYIHPDDDILEKNIDSMSFLLTASKRTELVYIPHKANASLINKYLESIKRHLR